MKFSINECKNKDGLTFKGLAEICPSIFSDERGYVFESYNENEFLKNSKKKINTRFVQTTESFSKKNVLRGLHFQKSNAQAKLVRCVFGKVLDVVVDLRNESKTFGKYFSLILDGTKHNALYVPEGFAHGFYVLSKTAIYLYKCTNFYDAKDEDGIIWNDKSLAIDWNLSEKNPIISKKDKSLSSFCKDKKYFSLEGTWIGV